MDAFLAKAGFTPAETSLLDKGQVVARAVLGGNDSEILVTAAVRIRAPRERVADYYGQMISYVDGKVTLAFGRFSRPPVPADVGGLAFDPGEVEDLRSCRPGRCDVRLSGVAIEALRTSTDWTAPGAAERINAFARESSLRYVAGYLERGDAALMTYDDRARPVSLKEQWLGILAGSPQFHDYQPALRRYLERFPAEPLPGARDVLYWVKEDFGLKPILSIVHGVVYEPPEQPDRTFVAQKQLYASHYYDGSLAVATLLDDPAAGGPATYLLYANRSRGDLLKGGFGGLKRNVAQSQAKKAAQESLSTIKRVLEGGR